MALTKTAIKARLAELANSATAPEAVTSWLKDRLAVDSVIGWSLAQQAVAIEAYLAKPDADIEIDKLMKIVNVIRDNWMKIPG